MQRFEGPTLEAALHEVIMAVGSDARIIKADTVRSGGVGGFFSREFVEIWVEVDDVVAQQTSQFWGQPTSRTNKKSARPRPVRSVGIGFDAREIAAPAFTAPAVEQYREPVTATPASQRRQDNAAMASAASQLATEATTDALLSLVDQINEEDRRSLAVAAGAEQPTHSPVMTAATTELNTVAEPQKISTEGRSFADVLSRIAEQTGHEPMPLARFVPSSTMDAIVPLVAEIVEPHDVPNGTSVGTHGSADKAVESRGFLRSEEDAMSKLLESAAIEDTTTGAIDLRPSTISLTPDDINDLRMLGVPEQYLPKQTALGDIYNRLVSAFRELPKPSALPTGQGSVIAVAGWRKAAIATAHDLAIRLGLDPADIVIASAHGNDLASARERTITSAQQATEQRRSWRWRDHPTIVVVDAALGTKDVDWASSVMRGLAPNTVWGVVDATRKSDDIADWGSRLGGMDAFAVVGSNVTRTPASVLEIGVPVALVDGEPATADRWATLLTNKLTAA